MLIFVYTNVQAIQRKILVLCQRFYKLDFTLLNVDGDMPK